MTNSSVTHFDDNMTVCFKSMGLPLWLALSASLMTATHGAAIQDTAYVQRIPGTTVSFAMMPVPGGTVQITGPDGPHTIEVGPFHMSETEIPWDLYDVWVFNLDRPSGQEPVVSRPTRPYVLPGEEFGHEGRPAIGISYHAATEFAQWLSRLTGHRYRLATEAEWEHACRLGSEGAGSGGIWHRGNANDRTNPVEASTADALGLRDMRGNIAEWVIGQDGEPVAKGGAFTDRLDAIDCSSSRKQTPSWNATDPQLPKSRWWLPDAVFVGFRVVRES
jgi:formylglycine-generating enzyme required for sulfatase activity